MTRQGRAGLALLACALAVAVTWSLSAALSREARARRAAARAGVAAIASAQRAWAREQRDPLRVATLSALAAAGLVDPALGSGTHLGYRFETGRTLREDPAAWVLARPLHPGAGDVAYYANRPEQVLRHVYAAGETELPPLPHQVGPPRSAPGWVERVVGWELDPAPPAPR